VLIDRIRLNVNWIVLPFNSAPALLPADSVPERNPTRSLQDRCPRIQCDGVSVRAYLGAVGFRSGTESCGQKCWVRS